MTVYGRLTLVAAGFLGLALTLAVAVVHPSSDSLVNSNPTPSRAKWAPLGQAYGLYHGASVQNFFMFAVWTHSRRVQKIQRPSS